MNRRFRHALALALCLGLTGGSTAWADFFPVALPDATYQGMTTKIPITAPDNLDATMPNISSLSDGNLTITFSTNVEPRTVGTVGMNGPSWAIWSSPPFAEMATNFRLMYLPTSPPDTMMAKSVTLSFNRSVTEFGVEMEQNSFFASTLEADFYSGSVMPGNLVGSIIIPLAAEPVMAPGGPGAARLFAALTTTSPFTNVVLSADAFAEGFGIAQFRYGGIAGGPVVPEPSSVVLSGMGLLGMAAYVWRRRKHNR